MVKNTTFVAFLQVFFVIFVVVVQQAQPFGKIANFVVNSRSRFARNIILVENKRLRSSQPRQAAER
jgi:Na+/H+ antiporter NhaB